MFDSEFYPTPENVVNTMLNGFDLANKTALEPTAGKGDIIDGLNLAGAKVLSCEKNEELAKICATKSQFIKHDFFTLKAEEISHINFIFMNPPFSNADKHILHAWEIAPAGCTIVSLVNLETLKNAYSNSRRELRHLIESYGLTTDLGPCFSDAERKTGVSVGMVTLSKGGASYETEFDGFFMEDEPEQQADGLIKYDFIRDIVNRYVESVKIFDKQLQTAIEMEKLTAGFFRCSTSMIVKQGERDLKREEFKKEMQKAAWKHIFSKLNLEKWTTSQLMQDINKFIETQQNVPFTMRNIYKMLEIVHGTTAQRMDRAILEVFDSFTQHHADNRYGVEGWETNSHFLLTKKFIVPYIIEVGYSGQMTCTYSERNLSKLEDLNKVLCFLTGKTYERANSFYQCVRGEEKKQFNTWYDWGFFRFKGYKKGTAHFEFLSEDVWALFNQNVARIKGFPLFEYKKQTAYQEKQTGRTNGANNYDKQTQQTTEAKILFTFKKQA